MKEVRELLKSLFKPEEKTQDYDWKIYAKLLLVDIEELNRDIANMQGVINQYHRALSIHSCSIHVCDKESTVLFDRMGKARKAIDEIKKNCEDKKIKIGWAP